MTLMILDLNNTVDLVYKFGALPLLMIAVWILWKKVGELEDKIEKKNASHIQDIKSHGEIYAGLLETTNYSNEETRRLIQEGLKLVTSELKMINDDKAR